MERRTLYAIVLLVIIIAGVGGGSYYLFVIAPGLGQGVPNPDTFIYQTFGDPDYIDPAVDYETSGGDIIQSVYEGLVWYDGESAITLVPRLCASWTVNPAQTEYRFYLRQGIKYHDGNAFNAYTMKYALDRAILINDPDGPSWIIAQCIKGGSTFMTDYGNAANASQQYAAALAYLNANGVVAFPNYTLVIYVDYGDSGTPTPYPAFMYGMAFSVTYAISPTFVWDHGGSAANSGGLDVPGYYGLTLNTTTWAYCAGVEPGVHNAYVDAHTCGTGPFKCTEWTPLTRIVLERNTNYWGQNNTINDWTAGDNYWAGYYPKVNRVIRMQVAEQSSRKLALLAGDCDGCDWPALYAPEIYDVPSASILDPKLIIPGVLKPTLNVNSMQLSLVKNVTGATPTNQPKVVTPFANKDFRLAFQYAFPYDAFIASAVNGHGVRMRNIIPEGMYGYDPTIPMYNTNATKAKAYLESAMAALGLKTITIQLSYNQGNDVRKTACLMMKAAIEAITLSGGLSVTCTVQEYVWATFLFLMRNKQLPVFFVGWLPDYPDPDNYMVYAHSGLTFAKRTGYANATIDALVNAAAIETNATARLAMYHEIQMEMYRSAHNVFMHQPTNFQPFRTWVHGWYFNPLNSLNPYWAISKS